MIQKGITVAVIFLFIGLAVAPSINANAVDSEMVVIDVEFYGLGNKHTVKLTQQEFEEFEKIYDEIDKRLLEVESRDEAKKIFKEAIIEFDKFNLLGGLSVDQAQNLIIGNYFRDNIFNRLDSFNNDNTDELTSNYLCFIAGHLFNINSQSPITRSCSILIEHFYDRINNSEIKEFLSYLSEVITYLQTFSIVFTIISLFSQAFTEVRIIIL